MLKLQLLLARLNLGTFFRRLPNLGWFSAIKLFLIQLPYVTIML